MGRDSLGYDENVSVSLPFILCSMVTLMHLDYLSVTTRCVSTDRIWTSLTLTFLMTLSTRSDISCDDSPPGHPSTQISHVGSELFRISPALRPSYSPY